NQNHKGRDITKPIRTTMLAHHLMSVAFSFFISRRTNIPTSGQNATMLRIFVRKKSMKLPLWVSPQHVTNKNQNSQNHDESVVLGISRLNEAHRPAQGLDESANEADKTIDNPSVPPAGPDCASHSVRCGAIHDTVNNLGVKLPQSRTRILRAINEERVVDLV